jgi:hypothetical protein
MAGFGAICALAAGGASASELSYTFLDFLYLDQSVDIAGTQVPVAGQSVFVDSGVGDGIALAGSLGLGDRFFLGGSFTSSIVDVTATVTNPLTTVTVEDNYDLIASQVSFGYLQPVGEDLDLILELVYDSMEYDFGSFAGENFDVNDSGLGGRVGFRWNPTRALELYGYTRFSPVGEVSLDGLEFQSDTVNRLGLIWYFFEDLGLGLDFESGQIDTFSISLRFSFGNLQW